MKLIAVLIKGDVAKICQQNDNGFHCALVVDNSEELFINIVEIYQSRARAGQFTSINQMS